MNPNPDSPVDKDLPQPSDKDSASHQQRLADALQGFLSEFEQGKLPDRSELMANHPEIADELSACLASLDFIHHAAPALTSQEPDDGVKSPLEEPAFVALGDFRIVREIGRGGMGVVYEAEQLTLGRRVALKVLPYAALLDRHQLQRFRNEARAAATLSHPHIVPVHYVGIERGVHYFAMQLIEGCSLAQVIDQLRCSADVGSETPAEPSATASRASDFVVAPAKAPTETGTGSGEGEKAAGLSTAEGPPLEPITDESQRIVQAFISTRSTAQHAEYYQQIARIGLQAAEALEYAHSYGIVHRDIKPANLLLDVERNVWLTDFGLARLESEATATITGDILGTLRYMSPEQARGDRHVVDPRSDIYGLGATLYELLTLSPLVEGADRQVILNQIANVEPKPLRPRDRTIPTDLETIVLTAVSKDPTDRYDTAGSMADDLRRFLTNQAIHARRPSLAQRLVRWSRRNRRALTLATTLLVLALTASTLICASAYSVAEQQRKQAELERERAVESVQLTMEAMDQLYADVVSSWLASDTVLTTLQLQYLEKAASTYERIIQAMPDHSSSTELLGQLWERIGYIRMKLDELDAARQAFGQAITFRRRSAEASPDKAGFSDDLVRCYMRLSVVLDDLGRTDEALQAMETSRQHLQQLVDRFPQERRYQYWLAGNDLNHGVFLLLPKGQPAEAERWARQAEQRLLTLGPASGRNVRQPKDFDVEASMILLQVKVCLAQALRYQQRIEDSRQQCQEGLGLCNFLRMDYRDHPNVPVAEKLLVRELAELELTSGQPEAAVSHFRRVLDLQRKGLRGRMKPSQWLTKSFFADFNRGQFAQTPTFRDEGYEEPEKFCTYAETQIRMACALRQVGRLHEAEQQLAEAEEISQYLADCYGNARYRVAWANSCAELALLLEEVRPAEAQMARERAASVWFFALEEAPLSRQRRSGLHGIDCDFDWFVVSFPECLTDGLPNSPASDNPSPRPPIFNLHNWGIQDLEAEMWDSAINRLTRAEQRRTEGHAFDWLYLAWAHFKKGETQTAREWFDKADEWIQQQPERNVELDELRAQVAQMMGV